MTGLNIVVKKVDKCVCIYIYFDGKVFFFLKNIIVLKKKKNYAIKISILSIN